MPRSVEVDAPSRFEEQLDAVDAAREAYLTTAGEDSSHRQSMWEWSDLGAAADTRQAPFEYNHVEWPLASAFAAAVRLDCEDELSKIHHRWEGGDCGAAGDAAAVGPAPPSALLPSPGAVHIKDLEKKKNSLSTGDQPDSGESPHALKHKAQMKAKQALLKPFRDATDPGTAHFVSVFNRFVCQHVCPTLYAALSGQQAQQQQQTPQAEQQHEPPQQQQEQQQRLDGDGTNDAALGNGVRKSMLFQAFPCIRIQQPSDFATIRPHTDRMYNHPAGTLNVWLPLTPTGGVATLWTESMPFKRDFHALPDLEVGQGLYGDMADCCHYTVANSGSATRVSLDFRVLPTAAFDSNKERDTCPFEVGSYYSEAVLEPGESEWRVVVHGSPSNQHGFPHTNKPKKLSQ